MKSMSTDYELGGLDGRGRAMPRSIGSYGSTGQRDVIRVVLLLTTVVLSCLLVYKSLDKPLQLVLPQWKTNSQNQTSLQPIQQKIPAPELERVLMNAAMDDNTLIITVLNQAWMVPNSTFDLFLESFQIGLGTKRLLKHVVTLCLDNKAYDRCLEVHPNCDFINATDSDELSGRNKFMSPGYLKLIWRRMDLLKEVLGYNFLFTTSYGSGIPPDSFSDADFQIPCNDYNGKPSDKNNFVNSGFTYVKANNKTLKFYEYWCESTPARDSRKDMTKMFSTSSRTNHSSLNSGSG